MSSLSFIGPAGMDPERYWIKLTSAALPTIGDAVLCGSILQGDIRRCTAQGIDADGVPFIPYSEKYAAWKLNKLGRNSPVDLFSAGRDHMLLKLVVTVGGQQYDGNSLVENTTPIDSFQVGIFSTDAAIIARAKLHNEGGQVRTRLGTGKKSKPGGKAFFTMPQRKYLDMNDRRNNDMTHGAGQAMLARVQAAAK